MHLSTRQDPDSSLTCCSRDLTTMRDRYAPSDASITRDLRTLVLNLHRRGDASSVVHLPCLHDACIYLLFPLEISVSLLDASSLLSPSPLCSLLETTFTSNNLDKHCTKRHPVHVMPPRETSTLDTLSKSSAAGLKSHDARRRTVSVSGHGSQVSAVGA